PRPARPSQPGSRPSSCSQPTRRPQVRRAGYSASLGPQPDLTRTNAQCPRQIFRPDGNCRPIVVPDDVGRLTSATFLLFREAVVGPAGKADFPGKSIVLEDGLDAAGKDDAVRAADLVVVDVNVLRLKWLRPIVCLLEVGVVPVAAD